MRVVYLAHKIRGDVLGNIRNVRRLLAEIHLQRTEVWAIAPYLDALAVLDDTNEADRARGFAANKLYFERKFIDELWICSDISSGVKQEIDWAEEFGIAVINKTV